MPSKKATLHLCIAPRNKRLLQQAASAAHASSLNQYVVSSALRQAEHDLLEKINFVMNGKNWENSQTLPDQPAREIPALKKLMESGDAFRRTTGRSIPMAAQH